MKPAIKKPLLLASVTLFASVVLGAGLMWFVFDAESPLNRESVVSATREWARLDPFPSSTRNMRLETTGSLFSREFAVEFDAPKADVQKWLSSSPGTSESTPLHQADGSLRFEIKPGGGAQFASIIVSRDGTHVRIRAYWS
jgi:hypothetical protein